MDLFEHMEFKGLYNGEFSPRFGLLRWFGSCEACVKCLTDGFFLPF